MSTVIARRVLLLFLFAALSLTLATAFSLRPIGPDWQRVESPRRQLLARDGTPLSANYGGGWNATDRVNLASMPDFLVQAFLFSEDRRYFEHAGVDWRARASALWQTARHLRRVRGASTISEQVVRLLHPRARTLWSKWLEGFEAAGLERQAGKSAILEFYLNQLPYASGRRGVAQAARYYFARDVETLSHQEMLALVVLARAPSSYDPYRHAGQVDKAAARLASDMERAGHLRPGEAHALADETLQLQHAMLEVNAPHFVQYARARAPDADDSRPLRTTLDAGLQTRVQALLDERLRALKARGVHNGAAIVLDHATGEILAWVSGGGEKDDTPGWRIDAALTPRQPGSALKPFVYALALDSGWTPATLIDDSPLSEAIGGGLHRFRNYSRAHYGPVTLRQALGNSLNIPALRAIRHVGVRPTLAALRALGFSSLSRGAEIYDEGLALGDGEVTLLELAQGYAALASGGRAVTARALMDEFVAGGEQIFSPEAATLTGDILSDPWARSLEFGSAGVMNLPVQTAVKTGTSTDYRDAWAVGYNYRYVAALWIGNLDQTPTDGVTGSIGPALTLRAIFSELTRHEPTRRLPLSPLLARRDICLPQPGGDCVPRSEYFLPGTEAPPIVSVTAPELVQPSDGLLLALDPRLPKDRQAFEFVLGGTREGDEVEWLLDERTLARRPGGRYLWPLERGRHQLLATVWRGGEALPTQPVTFTVK